MSKNPRELLLNIYVTLVAFITVSLVILVSFNSPDYSLMVKEFWIWALLVIVAELTPITLPRGGASLSVGGAIDFGIILLFPTIFAAAAGAISGLVSSISRKVDTRKAIFNVAMSSLILIVPSEIVRIYGIKIIGFQTLDLSAWPLQEVLIPYFCAAIAYFLLNTWLTSIAIAIDSGGNIWEVWRTNYMWTIASLVAMPPIGFVLASVYHVLYTGKPILGILGLSIFMLPLIVIRSSFSSFMNANKAYFGSIRALVSALDASHHYTQGHSKRVAENAVIVARQLRLSGKIVEVVEQGATLHDLGKIGMDNTILDKTGPLSDSEWVMMKQHPILGSRIITDLPFLTEAQEIVLHHHERVDGKGYPAGLIGEEIPIGARIVNVVDALDALTSERSYREALTPKQAIEILEGNAGKQFDTEVVNCIKELYRRRSLVFQEEYERNNDDILFTTRDIEEALQLQTT